ncbi:MAG TPA: methyltransferase domain-containing protein [Acidimicrobiales bacterium]|nr:methyltransferase domain-containing protein [Acidimicrobiales bacterium]
MPEPTEPAVDVDALVEQLRLTVEERRRQGRYPIGLEDDLEAHFRRIVSHRVVTDLSGLDKAMDALRHLPGLTPERIPVESSVPGGRAFHKALGRLLHRQSQGILEQVQRLAFALQDAIQELAHAVRQPNTHIHPDLVGQVDALQERLAALERTPVDSHAAVADLGRRVERLEKVEATRRFRPPFAAADFEARFRGERGELKERYRDLAARLDGCSPVLDFGCGRGEFIELLLELGVDARGVELDRQLVAAAVEEGLPVTEGDGLEELAAVPDGSLGGLSLIQVVEHLTPQQVVNLVSLAFDKLRPDGRVVIETVNPQSLYVFARAFYVDPTHDRPVHPAYLTFLFEQAGFGVQIEWRSPPPDDERLQLVGHAVTDANVERLNRLLFAPQDYALVAIR